MSSLKPPKAPSKPSNTVAARKAASVKPTPSRIAPSTASSSSNNNQNKPPAMTTATRVRRPKDKTQDDEADILAVNFEKKLVLSSTSKVGAGATSSYLVRGNGKGKETTPVEDEKTPHERALEAMRIFNAGSQLLGKLTKELKNAAGGKVDGREEGEEKIKECARALEVLRPLIQSGQYLRSLFLVERGALSLVGACLELGLLDLAISLLRSMYTSLRHLMYSPPLPSPPSVSASPLFLLSLPFPQTITPTPLPPNLKTTPLELTSLVLQYQQTILHVLFRRIAASSPAGPIPDSPANREFFRSLHQAFFGSSAAEQVTGGPLDWRRKWTGLADQGGEEWEKENKKVEAIVAHLFSSLVRGCVEVDGFVDPIQLLQLRTYTLKLYASSVPLPSSNPQSSTLRNFQTQHRKSLVLFGRHSSRISRDIIGKTVTESFVGVSDELRAFGWRGEGQEEVREVVRAVAKRAENKALMMLAGGSGDKEGQTKSEDEECAELLDKWRESEKDLEKSWLASAELANGTLEVLPHLLPSLLQNRMSPSVPVGTKIKIDKMIDRTVYSFVKRLRGERRLDQLLQLSSNPKQDGERRVVDKLVGWIANVRKAEATSPSSVETSHRIQSTAIEALILLAYLSFTTSQAVSYGYLERGASFLLPAGESVDSASISPATIPLTAKNQFALRTLASAYYNIAGVLFNEGKKGDALKFAKRAAEVTSCSTCRQEEEEDAEVAKAREDLQKHLSKRFELVALCTHAVGDKTAAIVAYISAVLHHSTRPLISAATSLRSSPLTSLFAHSSSMSPFILLVTRLTKLATYELLRPGAEVSLLRGMRAKEWDDEVVLMVLEIQLSAVEYRAEEVKGVLMDQLVEAYEGCRWPMRRARTLVRKMQHQCNALATASARDLSVEVAAAEIETLCSREDKGDDSLLGPYAQQYLAHSHLWLAFHSHRAISLFSSASVSRDAAEQVFVEAKTALKILRTAWDGGLPESPSKAPQAAGSPVATRKAAPAIPVGDTKAPATSKRAQKALATSKQALAFKTPQPTRSLGRSRAGSTMNPVTPPSREKNSSHRTPPKSEQVPLPPFDDPEKCYDVLDAMANLLGALGHVLLRIAYLKLIRRLASKIGSKNSSAYISASAHLGEEYTRLGKTSRAGLVFAQAESRILLCAKNDLAIPERSRITYLTLYAGYLAVLGNHDRSAKTYSEAALLAQDCDQDESDLPTNLRILERTMKLQRGATAAGVFSLMIQRKGELVRSLGPALQAMRLWGRAVQNISRLAPPSSPSANKSHTSSSAVDSFTSTPPVNPREPLPEFPTVARKRVQPAKVQWPSTGLAWQLSENLILSFLRVGYLYTLRGTAKSAEYYADQALSIAEDICSPRLCVRALALRVEVHLHVGNLAGAEKDLAMMDTLLDSSMSSAEAIESRRLRADLHYRRIAGKEAYQGYVDAQAKLDDFVAAVSEEDPVNHVVTHHPSPLRRGIVSPFNSHAPHSERLESVLPAVQAYLLRVRVEFLRLERSWTESQAVLSRLATLATLEEDQADEFKLLAEIQLEEMLDRSRANSVLPMLSETVLSIPSLNGATPKPGSPRGASTILASLRDVENLFCRAMSLSVSRSHPYKLRQLSLLTATHKTFYSSAGKMSRRSALAVAATLDLSLAVTLRREMLEAIDIKLSDRSEHDDLLWPTSNQASTLPGEDGDASSKAFWKGVQERYLIESAEGSLVDQALSTLLPASWTVISLHVAPKQTDPTKADSLLLVRHRYQEEPLVFKLPLDRIARREGVDEDDILTLGRVMEELKEIIASSNAGTQRAKAVNGKEERVEWWRERKALDARLGELVCSVEDWWFGAFKSILIDGRHLGLDALTVFKDRVERILKRSIIRAQEKKVPRVKLDDQVLACLAALPPTARDEDIEDLFYFVMESLQFTGIPVASDEIDFDQVCVDLRTALEELHSAKDNSISTNNDHTFLLLDKSLQNFPWESLPCLRGRSVSRLPALSFLRDRLDLVAVSQPHALPPVSTPVFIVNSNSTSFLLNPGGDLKNTQATFEPWLREKKKSAGWTGLVGRGPSDEEVKAALSSKELFLFFGHGGAEQYVRSQTIRNLARCAVTMLWGCSSGLLKDQGDYDPVGTPYHYMIARCPALVANLWDVTDKDIDKLSQSVFEKIGIARSESLNQDKGGVAQPTVNLTQAVATSRDTCNLRFLNGAATVVYGIPVAFSSDC
ncbi:hypothetical protein T439DRAFT_384325 [Meredithblackwellia eburnea MCA 4105]